MPISPEAARIRARIAAQKRHHPDADTSALERELKAATLAAHVERAIDDPVQLAQAARIVRAALDRMGVALTDLTPFPAPDGDSRDAA
ncbi:hypothetical protein PV416_13985 [Streptomyces ipomoeae]|jgi:hypothetical protein|uniref:hypothetical protein n=1 Tax=Streptomyces ipomoeae TaxID=103232 RepID=UPI0029AF8977|nr:hypothetical protein [Streptomyces ipomoeae]MDX2822178.1 hypothetical protein [Streptomyces ipomoeae]MDX2873773.1 hypothetical protein [Streptomyces ipomoeae]